MHSTFEDTGRELRFSQTCVLVFKIIEELALIIGSKSRFLYVDLKKMYAEICHNVCNVRTPIIVSVWKDGIL